MPTTKENDKIILAEIPDKNIDPEGYELVQQHMMHGPCGADRASSPCMEKGECSKNYPQKFMPLTKVDDKAFILYKRSEDGRFVTKGNTNLNNRFFVPHNVEILKKYKAHINVEWCSKSSAIKYLFKYITKVSTGQQRLYTKEFLETLAVAKMTKRVKVVMKSPSI